MNKKMFILLMGASLFITIIIYKISIDSKNSLKESVKNYYKIEQKVNRITYLRKKYNGNKKISLCSKNDDLLICNNLNRDKFKIINREIFKKDFPIKSFEISKINDEMVNVKVKIK